VFRAALNSIGRPHEFEAFSPYGYDERQFCSPGIDLPFGCLMRTPFGRYPHYHTSADDLSFIGEAALQGAFAVCRNAIERFDGTRRWRNLMPECEPQLGRRGLYDTLGGENDKRTAQMALLWMLNYSDGRHSTLDIAEMSGLKIDVLERAASRLADAQLLEPIRIP